MRSVRACGDGQVAPVSGQDACFAAVVVLSSERRETIEIVSFRYDGAGANGSRCRVEAAIGCRLSGPRSKLPELSSC
jgi:hypothetical protein